MGAPRRVPGRVVARTTGVLALATALLAAAPAGVRAQAALSCDAVVERKALADARSRLGRIEPAAAALLDAAQRQPGCAALGVAALVVRGWEQARELVRVAGAPSELGPVNDSLRQLDRVRDTDVPAAVRRQVDYGEAAIRAAVAASQDEREEMAVFLEHAAALSAAALPVDRPAWPLAIDEAAGELWLEVDRFAEARDALERAVRPSGTARSWLALARVRQRLGDRAGACDAYRRLQALDIALGPRGTAFQEQRLLECGY